MRQPWTPACLRAAPMQPWAWLSACTCRWWTLQLPPQQSALHCPATPPNLCTCCIGLISCLNIQVVDIEPAAPGPKELAYDAQWLAVLRETHHLLTPGTFSPLPASWTGAACNRATLAAALACKLHSGASVLESSSRCCIVYMFRPRAYSTRPSISLQRMQLILKVGNRRLPRWQQPMHAAGTAAPQPPPAEEHTAWVEAALEQHGRAVPANFCQTAPVHSQARAARLPACKPAMPLPLQETELDCLSACIMHKCIQS